MSANEATLSRWIQYVGLDTTEETVDAYALANGYNAEDLFAAIEAADGLNRADAGFASQAAVDLARRVYHHFLDALTGADLMAK